MGDFEMFIAFLSVLSLGSVIYNAITSLALKAILRRFGFLKKTRRDFYECGFKPRKQRTIIISLQYLLICVFFIMYDIELISVFPYVSCHCYLGLYDFSLLILFLFMLIVGLVIEYERHALWWEE